MPKRLIKPFTKLSAYWLAFFLLLLSSWLKYKFGQPNFEQFIYHVQFGTEGLVDVDPALIRSLIEQALLALLLALLIFGYEKAILQIRAIGFTAFRRQLAQKFRTNATRLANCLSNISYLLFQHRLPLFLIIGGSLVLLTQLSFWSYLSSLQYSNFLAETYVTPTDVVAPKHKKNLVLIYAESLEQTYTDKSKFGANLVKSLEVPFPHTTNFETYKQTPGTGWTIAGILSTQCGIPLRPVSMWDSNRSTEQTKEFLKNAVCLGDILKEAGYTNIFLGGAGLDFAGKGKFLLTHGYDRIVGRSDWLERGEKNVDGWGLYDDRLIANAKKEIDALERTGKPYNLTLLTLDTHGPDGRISPTCKNRGVKTYQDIVACTADIISTLLHHMKAQGYYKNTDIVIIGDHLSMQSPLNDLLEGDPGRSIYNRFYSNDPLLKNRNTVLHFDMMPSILYMLGFRFADSRLGLGASGFGAIKDDAGLYNDPELEAKLKAPSSEYQNFW